MIPFEIYELIHHPTIWKAGGITANIAIVANIAPQALSTDPKEL